MKNKILLLQLTYCLYFNKHFFHMVLNRRFNYLVSTFRKNKNVPVCFIKSSQMNKTAKVKSRGHYQWKDFLDPQTLHFDPHFSVLVPKFVKLALLFLLARGPTTLMQTVLQKILCWSDGVHLLGPQLIKHAGLVSRGLFIVTVI